VASSAAVVAPKRSRANTVSLLLNRGAGGFRAKRDYRAGRRPDSVAIADLNGSDAKAALRSEERRLLKSGAPAHDFTTEDRRRGAQRTNEIKRERAARRRNEDQLDLAEKLLHLQADKLLLNQAFNRLSQELNCSDCRRALAAVELVLKYVVKPLATKEPGILVAASAITERIRDLGFDAEAEKVATDVLRSNRAI